MAEAYTVDVCVFVNAFIPDEIEHAQGKAVMERLRDEAKPVIVPTLALPEVADAGARIYGNPTVAKAFSNAVSRLPDVRFVAVDDALAEQAVDMAAHHRLRGSDAIYAAVAPQFRTVLVTRDNEMLQRLTGVVTAFTPAAALTQW